MSKEHCPMYSTIQNEPSRRRISAVLPPRSPMTAIASPATVGVVRDRAVGDVGVATARAGVARRRAIAGVAVAGVAVATARTGVADGDSSVPSKAADTMRRMTTMAPKAKSPSRIREPRLLAFSSSGCSSRPPGPGGEPLADARLARLGSPRSELERGDPRRDSLGPEPSARDELWAPDWASYAARRAESERISYARLRRTIRSVSGDEPSG